jgi:hypothetical protein
MLLKSLRYVLIALGSCAYLSAAAQDKIYLTDGTVVQAKVKEISPKSIVYTRWDNKDGAEYVLTRREIARIVFENGTEERISRVRETPAESARERHHEPMINYGRNILAIAPVQMTNEGPAGFGIHYEHIADKRGIIGIYLPVAVTYFDEEKTAYTPAGVFNLKASRVFTYLYPGVKIYPAGSGHRVSYSVGPSLGLGFGDRYKENRYIDPNTHSTTIEYTEGSVFKAGFIINNGLNIQPTKSLYVGVELGLGIFYTNNETNDFSSSDAPMVQFNFKMGYRF